MVSEQLIDDVQGRVANARIARCGTQSWIEPPYAWPDIVKSGWPSIWYRAPWFIRGGYVDVIMAMSEHLEELDPSARVIDAFMDSLSGGIVLRVTYDVEAVHDIVDAYTYFARTRCAKCCRDGEVRELLQPPHAREIRCQLHQEGTR